MPSITVYPPSHPQNRTLNPLPQLLQTPSGLAILEIQGTINAPTWTPDNHDDRNASENGGSQHTPVGRLVFPLYSSLNPPEDNAWRKKVYLYVGKHQRLTGEVKELPKAIAVIRRKESPDTKTGENAAEANEELEIVEIIKHKILFSQRPEPVSG